MQSKTKKIALTAILSALTTLATLIYFPIPSTKIYFNLGESVIYLAALNFSPPIASLSAGIGSSLADILLGYPLWAPFTFAIKFSESLIISILSNRRQPSTTAQRIQTIIPGAIVMIAGYGFSTFILYGAKVVPLEITTDIGQCTVGLLLALLLNSTFSRLKSRLS